MLNEQWLPLLSDDVITECENLCYQKFSLFILRSIVFSHLELNNLA